MTGSIRFPLLEPVPTVIPLAGEKNRQEYVTFDGMAKVCAAAAGVADPQIVHYDPKSIEAPEHHDVF